MLVLILIGKLFLITLFCGGMEYMKMSNNISEHYLTLSLLVGVYKEKLMKDYLCVFKGSVEQIVLKVLKVI